MKKILILILSLTATVLVSLALLTACGDTVTTTDDAVTTTQNGSSTVDPDSVLVLADNGSSNYRITFPMGATRKPETGQTFNAALAAFRKAIQGYGYASNQFFSVKEDSNDKKNPPKYEILVGKTNRPESEITDTLAFGEAVIRVVGEKLIIVGYDDNATASAVHQFVDRYTKEGETVLTVPKDLDIKVSIDLTFCGATNMSYEDMAMEVWDSFNDKYWKAQWVQGTGWWDAAEVLETYIDAYEATGDKKIRDKMLQYATSFIRRNNTDWSYNEYNDDIAWAIIAFTRIYKLTGTKLYLNYAKNNFDKMFARAWDEKLGGGLYWKNDNTTKNACINCPASIAACLLGEVTGDQSYYDKATMVMDWVFKNLYQSNGAVIDSYSLDGKKNTWASTYNQGTFIGACNLLYQKTKDQKYFDYASKAADYAMKHLTDGGILNGEASLDNKDLPGFKGILTRWLYRFAKDSDNKEILLFLQNNAAVAFKNQNSEGLIWTAWKNKAPENAKEEDGYCVFGMSTAVALMFNSIPWDQPAE